MRPGRDRWRRADEIAWALPLVAGCVVLGSSAIPTPTSAVVFLLAAAVTFVLGRLVARCVLLRSTRRRGRGGRRPC